MTSSTRFGAGRFSAGRFGASLAALALAAACATAPAATEPQQATANTSQTATGDAEPTARAFDPAAITNLTPSVNYQPPEGISFKATSFISEGVRLTAQWLYASENEGKKLPTVIIAHGWGGTAANFRRDAVDFARAGYMVMLFDYRGWGESDSRVILARPLPDEPSAGMTRIAEVKELRGYIDPWEQTEDWANAISYAVTNPMVDADRIGIRGSSFSGGHVVYVAAHDPRVKALVSQVPSLDSRPRPPFQPDPAAAMAAANASATRLAAGQESYPEDRASTVGNLIGAPIGNKVVRWVPVEHAARVTAPALFIMAEKEELFSNENNGIESCQRIAGPRKAIMVPDIPHYGIYGAERELAVKAAIDWYDRYLKPAGAPTRIAVDRSAPERGDCRAPFVRPEGVGPPMQPPAPQR